MTPEESKVLAKLDQKVDDIKEDVTEIKQVMPLVYKHHEAIENLKKSQTWIKRIMLSVLTVSGLGALAAKIWPTGG